VIISPTSGSWSKDTCPRNTARNSPGANSRGKRAAEARQDVAEVSTALRIVLQGQEELD
jgi:hypothetical protein